MVNSVYKLQFFYVYIFYIYKYIVKALLL